VLGVETTHQLSAGMNREVKPPELRRIVHAVLKPIFDTWSGLAWDKWLILFV